MWPVDPSDDDGPWHAPGPPCPACGAPMPYGSRCCGEEECMAYVDGVTLAERGEPLGEEPMAAE